MTKKIEPVFTTKNFDVFLFGNGHDRGDNWECDVYLAFDRKNRFSHPVCTVTYEPNMDGLGNGYVHWIETIYDRRREGIGREVLLGLHKHVGPMMATGTTNDGKAFMSKTWDKLAVVNTLDEKDLKRQGYNAKQRRELQREAFRESCNGDSRATDSRESNQEAALQLLTALAQPLKRLRIYGKHRAPINRLINDLKSRRQKTA